MTTANQSGAWTPSSTQGINPVFGLLSAGTNYSGSNVSTQTSSGAMTGTGSGTLSSQFLGEPLGVWIGAIFLLLLLKFLSERPNSPFNPADIRINGYNVMAVGLSSAIFIIVMKVIFINIPVPGISQFVKAL